MTDGCQTSCPPRFGTASLSAPTLSEDGGCSEGRLTHMHLAAPQGSVASGAEADRTLRGCQPEGVVKT